MGRREVCCVFDQWSRRIVCPRTVWKSARAHISRLWQTHARARARVCASRGRWKGTGWLEGLYRFVDETTVIRHCVWPHPRLYQDLWTLRSSRPPAACASSPSPFSLPLAYRSPCYQFRSAVWLVTTGSVVAAMSIPGWPIRLTGLAT